MAIQRQLRRGTKAENDAFTGAIGELVQDTDNDRIIIHDGSKLGGFGVPNHNDVIGQYFQAVDGVGTDTITLTLPYAPSAYAEYQKLTFKPAANNTGAVTVNVNSLGAKDIQKDDGSGTLVALEANDLKANIPVDIIYDGVRFILNQGGGGSNKEYVLLSEQDVTNVTSIDFDGTLINNDFQRYEFYYSDVLATAAGNALYARASVDGGSSYSTASSYQIIGGSTGTFVPLAIDFLQTTGSGASGELIFHNVNNINGFKYANSRAFMSNTSSVRTYEERDVAFSGSPFNTNAINGIRFFMAVGNITGKIRLYGVK